MVTGDHPETARAIGREVGLWTSDALLIEGKDLPQDDEILGALMDRDGIIVSRVSPEEKLRIARALRKRGHVVAMTGDGVNDAPALHEAAIGVAMGLSGTDVAREAADLVLLDDNFATIVAAIEQGRTTFANTRRFLTYHLTDNVAELAPFVVWALSGGRFPLALGVLQVLCLDIGTDILPAVALGAEPSSPRALDTASTRPPPRGPIPPVQSSGHPRAHRSHRRNGHVLDGALLRRMETGSALSVGGAIVGRIGRGVHRRSGWPNGKRVRVPQRESPAGTTGLVFESIPGARGRLRSRNARWLSLSCAHRERIGAGTSERGRLSDGSARDSGRAGDGCLI